MRKILAVILSIFIILGVLPLIGYAEETPEIPEGYTPIYTKNDLDNIRLDLSGKYILMNDIVFTDEDYAPGGDFYNYTYGWNPIGPFTGEFNGNNFSIENLRIINPDQGYRGLFSELYDSAVVQNLELKNTEIQGVSYVGAIAGYTSKSSSIMNCSVSGNISGNNNVGGISGYMEGASTLTKIQKCVVKGTVSGIDNVGGIVGYVKASSHSQMEYGHSVHNSYPAQILNCANASAVNGQNKVAGICGYANGGGVSIQLSYNIGNVNASGENAGGLYGYTEGTLGSFYSTVNGVKKWNYWHEMPSASSCFNAGDIIASSFAGGLVGHYVSPGGSSSKNIGYDSCYNAGSVARTQGNGYFGPVFGSAVYDSDALYLEDVYKNGMNTLGVSKTDQELRRPGAYGFDFTYTWELSANAIYPYATLKGLPSVDSFTACQHKNTELQNVAAATCTEAGYTGDLVCLDCGETVEEGETINALGHDYVEHPAQAPTCISVGWEVYQTCTRCDYTSYAEKSVDPENHVNTQNVPETASTCIARGYTAGVYCNDCKQYISGHAEKALAEHVWNNGEVLREATCNQKGLVKYTCTVEGCGETKTEETTTAPNNHNYVSAVVAPTCTAQGYTAYTCTRCGDNYKDNYKAALGHADNNGDGYCDNGCGTQLTPTNPGRPSSSDKTCAYCGKVHPNNIIGMITSFFHSIAYIFARIFGTR